MPCTEGASVPWSGWLLTDGVQCHGGRSEAPLPVTAEEHRKRRSYLGVCSGSPFLHVSAEDVPPVCLSYTETSRLKKVSELANLGETGEMWPRPQRNCLGVAVSTVGGIFNTNETDQYLLNTLCHCLRRFVVAAT